MISAMAWVIAAAWFSMCCAAQFRWGRRLVTGRFVPAWAFFGPHPPQADIHLLFRDEVEDGDVGAWHELLVGRSAQTGSWLWRPNRRLYKTVEQTAQLVTRPQHDVADSEAYRTLMRLVCTDTIDTAARRRFLLATATFRSNERRLQVIFVSDAHRNGEK